MKTGADGHELVDNILNLIISYVILSPPKLIFFIQHFWSAGIWPNQVLDIDLLSVVRSKKVPYVPYMFGICSRSLM